MTDVAFPDALPAGYRLHWFVLEHVLGQGGFGITYLARDTNLDRRVAIKEYLPSDIARRRSDASAQPSTESQGERYAWGLERFLAEARTLARFDHPNIVRVYSVFEANNTAYMAMRFEEGESLAALLDRRGTLPEPLLLGCLLPILDGLQLVHDSGFIHRDIKPENIYVRQDGSPVLLDFGSARQSFGSTKTMTILVAPGYAPLEQYYGDAETQGPWTDIYGLGATCYRAITGKPPLDAIVRAKGVLGSAREVLPPAVQAGRGRYSERLLAAVDHALQLNDRDRPQRIADWRLEFADPPLPAAPRTGAPVVAVTQPGAMLHSVSSDTELYGAVPKWRSPAVRNLLAAMGALAAVASFVVNALRTAPAAPAPPPLPVLSSASEATAIAATNSARVQEAITPPAAVPVRDAQPMAAKMVAIAPRDAPAPVERDLRAPTRTPGGATSPGPAAAPADPPPASAKPAADPGPQLATIAPQALPLAPPPIAAPGATVPSAAPEVPPPQNKARDDQLEAAEAALRRGDDAAAADLLKPWAAAGVPRAQAMLGRAKEGTGGQQHSDFEAYVWYSLAARGGEPGAQAQRDKLAAKLQPAEVRQADLVIERWKPRAEQPKAGPTP